MTERTVNTDERLREIRERRAEAARITAEEGWMRARVPSWFDVDFLLSLIDSQAAESINLQVHIEERDAILDSQPDAATQMCDKCVGVAEDYRQRIEYEDDEGVREAMFGDMVMKMESLTLDQVVEKQ